MAWDHSDKECPECGKVVKGAGALGSHRKREHGVAPSGKVRTDQARRKAAPKAAPAAEPGPGADGSPFGADPLGSDAEQRPVDPGSPPPGPDPGPKRRRFGMFGKDAAAAPTREPRPRSARRRVYAGVIGEYVFAALSRGAATRSLPVSRCLAMQTPYVGKQFDEAIKGTWVDRVVQPLARMQQEAEGLGTIVGMPILVGLYERMPEMRPALEPALREMAGVAILQMAEGAKAVTKRREQTWRALEELGDLFPEDMVQRVRAQGGGPDDLLLAFLFAPPQPGERVPQPPPPPDEAQPEAQHVA